MRLAAYFLFALSLLPSQCLARQWKRGDACPDTVRTTVPNEREFGTMESVHRALLHCPNMTSLDLRVALLGCSNFPDRGNFPFALSGGETYPRLKQVRLEGYELDERLWDKLPLSGYSSDLWWPEKMWYWLQSGNMQQYLSYRNLEQEQRDKTNLELWVDAMDWGSVEVLMLRACRGQWHFMESMAPRLRGLKILEIWEGWNGANNNTLQFIQNLVPGTLTNLTWREGWKAADDALFPILQRHNTSLRSLEIRTEEASTAPTAAFSASQLQQLFHSAPMLEHLSVNVYRNGSWPYDVLGTIAQAKELRTVELWFDILSNCSRQRSERYTQQYLSEWMHESQNGTFKCEGEKLYQRPFVDEQSAPEVFKYMREKNTSGKLNEVVFWVGDWSRPWDGPIHLPDFIEGKRAKVACTLEGKVEGEAWCVVEAGKRYWARDESSAWEY